jgi:hypothetical protein
LSSQFQSDTQREIASHIAPHRPSDNAKAIINPAGGDTVTALPTDRSDRDDAAYKRGEPAEYRV